MSKPFVYDPDTWVPGMNLVICQLNYASPAMHLPNNVDHLTYNNCLLDTLDLCGLNDDSLRKLELYGCTFRVLKGLPSSLQHLSIQYSNIERVELPPNLKTLVVNSENSIEFTELPATLQTLHFECFVRHGGGQRSLPKLPPYLKTLECSAIHLDVLPELPATLTHLDCSYNRLTTLPPLPDSLLHLDCAFNDIEGPMPTLPKQLLHLDCSVNKLTALPTLPSGLRKLDCSKNLLTAIPRLPSTLRMLNFARNPIERYPYIFRGPGLIFISKMHPYYEEAMRGFAEEECETDLEEMYEVGDYSEHHILFRILEIQQQADCRVFLHKIKEELMIKTWHPSRIEAWCGVNFSDPEHD